MNSLIKTGFVLLAALFMSLILQPSLGFADSIVWTEHRPGLWISEITPPPDIHLPSQTTIPLAVVRIDPEVLEFKLLTSSESGLSPMPIRVWAERFGLVAGINASMFLEDFRTSTGHMRNFQHQNNSKINSQFGAFLAFHPLDPALLPKAQIIDRTRDQWPDLIKQYQTIIQNFRIIAKPRGVVWIKESVPNPIACVAKDQRGHILFIHSHAAYPVREFGEILLALPLGIEDALYVEGGPPASLYVREPGLKNKKPLPASFSQVVNAYAPLPNVLGVVAIPDKR